MLVALTQVYWHARTSPEIVHTEPTPECPRRKRKRMENKSRLVGCCKQLITGHVSLRCVCAFLPLGHHQWLDG